MNATPSLRDQATSGVAWSAFHLWGSHAIQLGAMLVLVRLLEPRAFGLFAMAQVVLVLLRPVVDQGIPDALVQTDRDDPRTWSTGFLAVLSSCLMAAAILALGAPLFARALGDPELTLVLRWLAPGVVIYGIHRIYDARIRAGLSFSSHAKAGITAALASLVAGVSSALFGWGVWALVMSLYAGQIVETFILRRSVGGIPLVGMDWTEYRRLLGFGRYIVMGSFTTFLNRRTDDYFVGLFLGAEILGFYTVAYQLLELLTTVFLRAAERVAFPVFSKLRLRPALVGEGIRTTFRFTSLVAFPGFVGLILIAPDLVLVALGDRWQTMIGPLRILAAGGVALCATNALPAAIRALGRPGWNVTISAFTGVILAVAFAFAAQSGIEAVAWVFTLGAYGTFPLFFVAAGKVIPISAWDYLREGLGPLAATAIMTVGTGALIAAMNGLSPLARLCLSVVGGGTLYLGAILLVARKHVDDLSHRLRALRGGRPGRR